ncbi:MULTISPECIES: hypothetical protein [unclassified Kitasatospora]|uniref:WD40 repeat domain-containing protein n=1 Tax=unclassified Kitasatospora TaxID=2633591 RepID=UPI003406F385
MVTAFSPDGSLLATGEPGGVVRLWDPITRHPVGDPMVGSASNIFAVAFSPDGSLLASGGSDGVVRLWDPATRHHLGELPGDSSAMAFSPEGSLLAVGNDDGSVLLYSRLAQLGRT